MKSERRSPLVTKIMHCQLAADARLELWAGRDEGSVTYACGRVLAWNDRTEIGPLQWHMLECTMPQETAVWKMWYGAVSSVIASATDGAYARDAIMACWSSDSNGWFIRPRTTKTTGGAIRRLRTPTDTGSLTQRAPRSPLTLALTGTVTPTTRLRI